MDVGQAWIWTLLPLFLDTINLTATQSSDRMDSPQDLTNLDPEVDYSLEDNESGAKAVPIAYRLLTTGPILNTLIPRINEELGEPLSIVKNLAKLSYPSPISPEEDESNVENTQGDTKEDFNQTSSFLPATSQIQTQIPLLKENTDNIQQKNDSVHHQEKPSETSTRPSTTPLLRGGNDIQITNDTRSDIQAKAPEFSINVSVIPLSKEGITDIGKKNDTVSDVHEESPDISVSPSTSVRKTKENYLSKTYPTPENMDSYDTDFLGDQNKIAVAPSEDNALLSVNPAINTKLIMPTNEKAIMPLLNVPKFDLGPSSDLSDMIMDTIIEQPTTYATALLVRDIANQMDLRSSTETYVKLFNNRYALLPHVDADNLNWHKFARAVVESFVLDFCRLYSQKYYDEEDNIDYGYDQETDNEDDNMDYTETFSLALSHLREKKRQTARQLAVPVINTADAFKVALNVPVGIVQSKCKAYMSEWQCYAHYIANLIDEAEVCADIWHHANLHLKVLQIENYQAYNPTEIIIKELEARKKLTLNRKTSRLFDFIVRTIRRLRNRLADSLILEAKLYQELNDLKGLGCFKLK